MRATATVGSPGKLAPAASTLRGRDFRALVLGQGVSAFGDFVSATVVPLLVLSLTRSGGMMALVSSLARLPDLLVAGYAGVMADRWDRRRTMFWTDMGRGALTALIPLAALLRLPVLWVIVAVVVPLNVLRVMFLAAYEGALPQIVGRAHVGAAVSLIGAMFAAMAIAGPAAGGFLYDGVGPVTTLLLDAGSFIVSAATLVWVRGPLRATDAGGARTSVLADLRRGVAFLLGHRVLRVAVPYASVLAAGRTALLLALTYYITVDLDRGPRDVGLVMAACAAGALVGALASMRMKQAHLGARMLLGPLATGLLVLMAAVPAGMAVVAAVVFLAGAADAIGVMAFATVRTLATPDALLGRVGSVVRTLGACAALLGALASGALLDRAGGATVLVVVGALFVASTLAFGLRPTLRRASLAEQP